MQRVMREIRYVFATIALLYFATVAIFNMPIAGENIHVTLPAAAAAFLVLASWDSVVADFNR